MTCIYICDYIKDIRLTNKRRPVASYTCGLFTALSVIITVHVVCVCVCVCGLAGQRLYLRLNTLHGNTSFKS